MSLQDQKAAAIAAGKAERLTTTRWKWVEGAELLGVYAGRALVKSTKKDMPDFFTYDFVTDDGPVNVLFSGAFDKGPGAELQGRHLIGVKYMGKIDLPKNRTMHAYEATDYGIVVEAEAEPEIQQ